MILCLNAMNATVKPEQCKTIRLCVYMCMCVCVCVCVYVCVCIVELNYTCWHCSGAYNTHMSSKVMLIFYVWVKEHLVKKLVYHWEA